MDAIKSIILDYQDLILETGVPRRLQVETVHGKATVCIGVRRCGKSTYMYQRMQRLLDAGVPRENILYVNFFDDRLHHLKKEGLKVVAEAYYALYPEKKNTEKVYCFFDEIQAVDNWEPFVDRLMRTEKCEIYITGSSAHMLSTEVATQMRGRALSWELFPFSFREYLDYRDIDGSAPFSSRAQLMIRKAFEGYWGSGGFPEVAGLDKALRVKIHQDYFQAILFRDLVERHDVSHPRAVMDLAHRLVDNTASLYSINRLTGYLKSLGHRVPKSAVSDYLAWFEDAYFLFTVKVFDASAARRNTNPKKIYCIDHALVTSVSSSILVNAGHLLENMVYTALRRRFQEIYYYKTKAAREVDFVVPRQNDSPLLIQVCESLADTGTRKREIRALTEAMAELDLQHGTIVTREETDHIKENGIEINVMSVWRFLLENEAESKA